MSINKNEKNDLSAEKESDVTDFEKGLDALLNKEDGSEQEAVEVMTAKVKELCRQHADRKPWVKADYFEREYWFWLGNCILPHLRLCREECKRLRRTLKEALRQKVGAVRQLNGRMWIYVVWSLGLLWFTGNCGVETAFRFNRRRCQELIDALAPANLDQLKR